MRSLLVIVWLLACAWLAPTELHAALDFDLNEPPPPEDDEELSLSAELSPAAIVQFNSPPLATRRSFQAAPTIKPFRQPEVLVASQPDVELPSPELAEKSSKRRKLRKQTSEEEQKKTESRGLFSSLWTRVSSSLPAYFDFDSFARKFKRHYKQGEAFLRRSIFLQKCYAIFKSRVASRLGTKSYIESVNKFSDRTEDELKLMYMPAPPVELSSTRTSQTDKLYRERLEQIERLNDENYRPELESRCSLDELGSSNGSLLMNEQQTKELIEELLRSQDSNIKSVMMDELRGHEIEQESRADLSQLDGGDAAELLPWPGQQLSSQWSEADENEDRNNYKSPHLERGQSLDWSRHECFHEIYDQGKNCGSCYVMAATTLAEFYKCSERGPGRQVSKRKFSKEFVLHCGQKYAPSLMGCAGGSPLDTLKFIAHSGIYNIRDWRQKRTSELKELRELAGGSNSNLDKLDLLCPLQVHKTPLSEWGNTRVLLNPRKVPATRWLEALQDGPLVVSVQMPSVGVDSYSSGVHDGEGCATSGAWHAMLLVGYGRDERGQSFWRFRNSFGRDWGESGHFRLSMDVPGACLPGGVRVYREELSGV